MTWLFKFNTMKKYIFTFFAALISFVLSGQQVRDIPMLESEKWWGSITDLGNIMPFDDQTSVRFNHQIQNFNNQTTPLLVSNKGRYIWSDGPFAAVIKDGVVSLDFLHQWQKPPIPDF